MAFNFLYIDPGTGSMLFSVLMGVAATLFFALRALAVKIRFAISGGKAAKITSNKIPYVIFSDHKRYWNVFKPICDEFERRKIPLVYYTQSSDDPALFEKYEFVKAEFIGEGNKGFVRMNMLNAGTVLSTTPQLDVLQWKRSKNVDKYVHIPHSADDLSGYRIFALDYYDAVLVTGEHQKKDIRFLEELRGTKKKNLVTVGATYLDQAKVALEKMQKPQNKHTTVLVAPSWGGNSILNVYGERLFDALLKTDFDIIIRPHPQSKMTEADLIQFLEERYKNEPRISWNYDNDNMLVLNKSDIMITDFSGIIFDYSLLFNKPLMYADTTFDKSVYDAYYLKYEMWRFTVLPKIGIKLSELDFPKIGQVINDALGNKEMMKNREEVKNIAWANIGHAAESVADYLVNTKAEEEK